VFDPVMGGVNARGAALHATHETRPVRSSRAFPHRAIACRKGVPKDAIIVAANGGSEYLYVPSHEPRLVRRLVTALQERAPYGPVFVRAAYGAVPARCRSRASPRERSIGVAADA